MYLSAPDGVDCFANLRRKDLNGIDNEPGSQRPDTMHMSWQHIFGSPVTQGRRGNGEVNVWRSLRLVGLICLAMSLER